VTDLVGEAVADSLGAVVGEAVGDSLGAVVGEAVGDSLGAVVGKAVGDLLGAAVGETTGLLLGYLLGTVVGFAVLAGVGWGVAGATALLHWKPTPHCSHTSLQQSPHSAHWSSHQPFPAFAPQFSAQDE